MSEPVVCDHCRSTIDTASERAMIVSVHRNVDAWEWDDESFWSGNDIVFRYCSQEHASAHLGRVSLPAIVESTKITASEAGSCLVVGLLGSAAAGLWIYGGIQLWQNVVSAWF